MSSRTTLRPNPVIVNGDMSGNITSAPTVLQSMTIASYAYSWVGTVPVGAISIEVSNDYAINGNVVINPGTWVVVPISSGGVSANSVPLTGNSGEGYIEGASGAYAVRTKYSFTSGIGTLQVVFVGKVF